jgi:hypothetical protein
MHNVLVYWPRLQVVRILGAFVPLRFYANITVNVEIASYGWLWR